ncbi:MAG: sensor histidine kinase [Propionibacteriaceae bacterium]
MNPTGLVLVALVLGLLVGCLAGVALSRARQRRQFAEPVAESGPEPTTVTVPAGIADVLEVLRSAAVLVGPHDEVLSSSDFARTLGLARGSRVGIAEILDLVRRVRSDRTSRSIELDVKRGTGLAVVSLAVQVSPLAAGLVLVFADDQTAALRIEETRRDFLANVSHELKTPIGAIALLAEAVGAASDDPDAVRRFAGRMETESDRLAELVGQIIDLSRLQGDEPLRDADLVDVEAVLHEAVDRARVDAERNNVTLAVRPIIDCTVLGSTRLLTVAVHNLVQNAVAYSDAGARVVVAAQRGRDDTVSITVSDNGIGIAPKDLDRIFERFYRVDYARSRANGGTGLGLSVVKHIAAAHGGDVSVWSQVGQGSTFTVTVPAHLPKDAPPLLHSLLADSAESSPSFQEINR